MLFAASRARISLSRALSALLFITLFTFGLPQANFLPKAVAASFGSSACTSDFTDTTNLEEITLANYCIVRIKSGTTTWTPTTGIQSLYVLAVGGGGGGGNNAGGGGAGGAVAYGKYTVGATTNVTITVGGGGAGGSYAGSNNGTTLMDGQTGGSTTVTANTGIMTLTAAGGSGGQTHWADNFCGGTGSPTVNVAGGAVSSSGAYSAITNSTGGSGGGWAVNGVNGGAGGAGNSRNITGTSYSYGAGGGGGAWNASGGAGGSNGGGAGGGSGTVGTAGTANSGSGGGGGGDGCSNGGAGGSGVVILRWIPRPTVTTPANATSLAGRTATFTTTASSSTTLTRSYQWGFSTDSGSTYTNVTDGSGATTTTYTTGPNLKSEEGYRYRLSVTDGDGTVSTVGSSLGGALIVNYHPGFETDTALSLNGTNQVAQALDDPAFDIANAITVEAWVYMRSYNPNNWNMIVNKEASYELGVQSGVWKYAINGTSGWQGVSTTIPYVLNEWQHVAFTRAANTNTVKFYVNGVMAYGLGSADGAGSGSIANSPDYLTIGGRRSNGGSTSAFFDGMIDEVRIFESVRTDAEIASDMHTYGPINSASLKAYFDFNDTSGSTIVNKAEGGTTSSDLGLIGSPSLVDVKSVDSTTQTAYTQITFNRTYITAIGGWRSPATRVNYTSLVVAGGGAGGARVSTGAGGGGGGGGMVESVSRRLDTSTIVAIQVGQGGIGTRTGTMTTIAPGSNGQNSFLKFGSQLTDSFTAIGGGGGAGGYGADGDTSYRGLAGGSGGGASGSNVSGYSGGAALQQSGSGFTGYGNAGGMNPGCSSTRPAGGGGGAGGAGVTPQTCSPAASGAGGAGRTSSIISGTFAGGGGGGQSGDGGVTAGTGGSGGGAAGSGGTLNASTSEYYGNNGTANTGGGGGGVGISSGIIRGGSGGSGLVVIRYLTFELPIYAGLANDTTTAGLTYTFAITGTPNSPFVRSYLWQSSNDFGSTWANISVGSGFTTASYTTPTLETTTSGSRYQYRVVVTDSNAGVSLIDTSTGVYLVINARITITGSYTPVKYGNARTETFTVDANSGTGTKTIRRTSSAKPNITWDTSTANIARVTVAANLSAGTYIDTLTVTDQESATTTLAVTITVLKADTVTVTVASRIDTYTASSLSYTDTFTVTGLVASDTLTVSGYQYSGTANDGTVFSLAGRPAIAGSYAIVPTYSFPSFTNYESVTVNNGTLTINRKSRTVTISSRPTTLKYGSTGDLAASVSDGGTDGVTSFETITSSLCSISTSKITALDASGNCLYTATISRGFNYETATSISYSTALAVADTVTVTVLPITPVTYTGSQAVVSPRISVTGLFFNDTATAISATFKYRSSTISDTFTITIPTNSDTYTVNASLLTLTQGSLSRYAGVTYVDGTFRINKAQQKPLYLAQYRADFGAPYKLVYFGGSGAGSVSQSVTDGTAQGCLLQTDTLSSTTSGSCLVVLTKSAEQNYETQTVTAEVFFLTWIQDLPAPTSPAPGPTIIITGETAITRNSNALPTISSFGASGDATYPVAINGSGFSASSAAETSVKFWMGKYVDPSDFIIKSDSLIWTKVAAGATNGPLHVENRNGTARSTGSFQP